MPKSCRGERKSHFKCSVKYAFMPIFTTTRTDCSSGGSSECMYPRRVFRSDLLLIRNSLKNSGIQERLLVAFFLWLLAGTRLSLRRLPSCRICVISLAECSGWVAGWLMEEWMDGCLEMRNNLAIRKQAVWESWNSNSHRMVHSIKARPNKRSSQMHTTLFLFTKNKIVKSGKGSHLVIF